MVRVEFLSVPKIEWLSRQRLLVECERICHFLFTGKFGTHSWTPDPAVLSIEVLLTGVIFYRWLIVAVTVGSQGEAQWIHSWKREKQSIGMSVK